MLYLFFIFPLPELEREKKMPVAFVLKAISHSDGLYLQSVEVQYGVWTQYKSCWS